MGPCSSQLFIYYYYYVFFGGTALFVGERAKGVRSARSNLQFCRAAKQMSQRSNSCRFLGRRRDQQGSQQSVQQSHLSLLSHLSGFYLPSFKKNVFWQGRQHCNPDRDSRARLYAFFKCCQINCAFV